MVGKKLGHYEIVAAIGAGGMGEVYRARDTRLDRTVAIKILPPHLAERSELRARLEREARVVSGLSHPNICTLYDIGESDGVFFLVMEFLEGETLAQRLTRERIPTESALRIGAEIGSALQRAHRSGVIHRDLKPGNVMLTKDGAKLLDFGLAKMAEATGDSGASVATRAASEPLTERGTILGTFQYMAPEQLEGRELDARTDVFSFGAVLYEMVTGQKAFQGQSRASLIAAILEREPRPISDLQPLSPPALDRVVRRCLAKNPDDRWQSAGDVASELRWILDESSRAGVPRVVAARRRSREQIAWAACAVLAVAAAALGFQAWRGASRPERAVRTAIELPDGATSALSATAPGAVAISPDGRRIVYAARSHSDPASQNRVLLYVRELDAWEARVLPGTEDARFPFWSPDGHEIAFFTNEKLKRIEAGGGPAFPICDTRNGKGGTWGKDGTIVFAPTWNDGLSRVSSGGGEVVPVTTLDSTRTEDSHRLPSFLPDGRRFLYLARGRTDVDGSRLGMIMLGSLDGDPPREIMPSESQAIAADGYLLFVRENSLFAREFDGKQLRGDPAPLAEQVEWLPNAMVGGFSVIPGVLAYHPLQEADLVQPTWTDATGNVLSTMGDAGTFSEVTISDDGSKVAMVDGNYDIWIADVATGVRTRFAADPALESSPVWSPDGTTIIFSSSKNSGVMDFFRKSLGGTADEELVFGSPESEAPTDWSPDGKYLAYDRGDDLWILPLGGGDPFIYAEGAEGGHFSPDGRWIMYTSRRGGRPDTFVAPFPATGREWQVSVSGGAGVGWWMGGAAVLLYEAASDRALSVPVDTRGTTLQVGAARVQLESPDRWRFAVPHGDRFLAFIATRMDSATPIVLVQNWKELIRRRS